MKTIQQGKYYKRTGLWLAALLVAVSPLLDRTFVSAATVTSRKDTLSTSAPGANANHTIQFVTPTAVTNGQTIILTFDTMGTANEFDLTGLTESGAASDFDIAEDTDGSPASCSGTLTDETLDASQGAAAWGVAVNAGTPDTVTFTAPSNAATYIAAGSCIVIEIGTNATNEFTGVNQINNPAKTAAAGTSDVNDVVVTGSFGNTGSMLVATIDQVNVSATIAESLSFTIAGMAGTTCDDDPDSGSPSYVTTTATAVPFGTIATPNTFFAGCQDLTITTNATDGYIVTAEENTSLLSGANTLDDTACDAACDHDTSTVGSAWATSTNNGLGFWCDDTTSTPCRSTINTNSEYKRFACTGSDAQCDPSTGAQGAQIVLTKSGPVNGDVGRVHYKLSVGGLQPAGTYTNTLTYIATPSF